MSVQLATAAQNPAAFDELRKLTRKVDKAKPDPADVAELSALLYRTPALWRICGDLAEQAALRLIEEMNAPRSMKRSMQAGLSAMADELARPDDGPLESLIIRQIVGAWVRLAYTEYAYNGTLVAGNQTLAQADFWERRMTAAERRYLRACETLARVRRLRLPAVQVNIAEQQVNQVNTRG